MEITKGTRTLFWLYMKQIMILAMMILAEAAVFVLSFVTGMNVGIILPANDVENQLREQEGIIAESEPFDASVLPDGCQYGIFDTQGNYQSGNMKEKVRKAAGEFSQNPDAGKSGYMVIARKNDVCVIHYPISARFANPALYRIFPQLEAMLLLLFAVIMILIVVGNALHFRKKLTRELTPLLEEIEQIKQQELRQNPKHSKIKEFDDVLTALNAMKEELSRSLAAEWETEQRRKENISALAHDIKTPLTIIKGNTELMQEETELEEIYELAESVNRNIDKMERYMKLLMEQTKEEHMETKETEVDLSEFLENIAAQSISLGKINQTPVEIIKPSSMGKVLADGESIQRAVINLVVNAIEHTEKAKGIRVTFRYEKMELYVEIEDFGTGFSKEALRRAKEQFYTERTERSGEHYGLGMYFAQCIAAKYHGELTYYNKENGNGAVVVFKVKFCPGNSPSCNSQSA